MKRFLTLLAVILFAGAAAMAQTQKLISFKAMGITDDMPIFGMSGATSLYHKITPEYEVNGSKLVLYIEPSQALIREKSFINIFIGTKPVYSGRLTKDSIQRIGLAISRADVSADHFLKLQIKTALTISDDKCRDLDNPAMWIKVKNYSYVSLTKSTKNFLTTYI